MSGHSKWSTIKHKKAAIDAKRGKIFTKLIRELTVAAKQGGAEIDANPRLRLAVAQARGQNMPNDTIQRAIKKGAGSAEGSHYEEIVYEGYGPFSVAVMVETLTDNRNRTAAAVRAIFSKNNGNLGSSHSVQHLFQHKGVLTVPKANTNEETLTDTALEGGADDLVEHDGHFLVYCPMEQFDTLRNHLEGNGVAMVSAQLEWLPTTNVKIIDQAKAEKLVKFLDLLEDDDDVQKVFSNFDLSDELTKAWNA